MFSTIIDRVRQSFKFEQKKVDGIHGLAQKLNHVMIITDGHRRWARERGLSIRDGYNKLIEVTPGILDVCWQSKIHTVTMVVGTTKTIEMRPKDELVILFDVLNLFIDEMVKYAFINDVRIVHIGRKDRIPVCLKNTIEGAENITHSFKKCVLNIALDYGARDEIVMAIKKIAATNLSHEVIDEKMLGKFMYMSTQKYPEPDLVIRTGRVVRFSELMNWNLSFSEWYFSEKYYPDFTPKELLQAFNSFYRTIRRFGA